MNYDDDPVVLFGREVIRMINDLLENASQGERGFDHRKFTFRGGQVTMLLVNNEELAKALIRHADVLREVKAV